MAVELPAEFNTTTTVTENGRTFIRLVGTKGGSRIPKVVEDRNLDFGCGVLHVALDETQQPIVDYLITGLTRTYRHPETDRVEWVDGGGVVFPRRALRTGDVIPLAGTVCRITWIGGKQFQGKLSAEVIPPADLPPGVVWPRALNAIPLKGKFGVWAHSTIEVDEIVAPDAEPPAGNKPRSGKEETPMPTTDEAKARGRDTTKPPVENPRAAAKEPTATITLRYSVRLTPLASMSKVLPPREVRVGDLIEMPIGDPMNDNGYHTSYVVRGIVPPDAKRRIIGWILVEPAGPPRK